MKKESKFAAKGPGYRYSDLSQRCTESVRRTGHPDNEAKAQHRASMERQSPLDNRQASTFADDLMWEGL